MIAGRHRVPAALEQEPVRHRLPHRAAEIDARDRAARSGADAADTERDRESRASEFLLQPRRHQSDDAGMPALRRRDDHGALLFQPERGQCLRFRLGQHVLLHRPPLVVQPVEFGGNASGFGRILFQQEIGAEIGAPDAAAGIDARPEQKAEMIRLRRAVEPRRIHQRGEAGILPPAHRDQTLRDEGAVESLQRHDIRDGAERDQIERRQQIGLAHARRRKSRAAAIRD